MAAAVGNRGAGGRGDVDLFGAPVEAADRRAGGRSPAPAAEPPAPDAPLAARLRPSSLADVVGQDHLIGDGGAIARMVAAGQLRSFILWGPPGVGKTTIARAAAAASGYHFCELSAVFSGVADLRRAFDWARDVRAAGGRAVLFVDEIHRFNRAQQDAFLPPVENGDAVLIGATTENPSFELNGALLSRAATFILKPLEADDLKALARRGLAAIEDRRFDLTDEALDLIAAYAGGDGRRLFSMLEELAADAEGRLDAGALKERLSRASPRHDKSGDGHYDLASALQKSIRGSDVDAALYWAARLLNAGESPRFILRRLMVTASEDIGNADPEAVRLAVAAREAFDFLGRPEGDIVIGQLTAYLAAAPKSNRAHAAFKAAKALAAETAALAPPPHAVNAPTDLMKAIGRGEGYIYDHDAPDAFGAQNFLPHGLQRPDYYRPREVGAEAAMKERMAAWARRRREEGEEGAGGGERD